MSQPTPLPAPSPPPEGFVAHGADSPRIPAFPACLPDFVKSITFSAFTSLGRHPPYAGGHILSPPSRCADTRRDHAADPGPAHHPHAPRRTPGPRRVRDRGPDPGRPGFPKGHG